MTPAELAALRRGDPDAIDRFYRDHAPQVLGWVIRLGGPGLDAEDVAQDVFIVAVRRLSEFRGDAKPSTWLFAIARRVIANARRRAAFRRFFGLESVPEPPAPGDLPDEIVDKLQRRRKVQEALETLSQSHREAVALVDLDGRSAPEAAEMLGIPVGTVHSRLHHARRLLAVALEGSGLAPAPTPETAR